ncbi:MAG: hypothetical protein Q8M76_13950 [Spirochaetaceae bacterium]|nr:hypothetical protein [Spirochaetaceae bacterium]
MKAGEARSIARSWLDVERERASREGGSIDGAFFTGSINALADADDFPATSDLDLCVILSSPDPSPRRIVKRAFRGLVIEPFYLPRENFPSAEEALADFSLACHLVEQSVVYDPQGLLRSLQDAMADRYGRREWVLARCASVRDHSLALMSRAQDSDSLCFVNAILTHAIQGMAQMLLLADLRAPTVKQALVRAAELLERLGMPESRDRLLRLLGADRLGERGAEAMAADCATALREAVRVYKTPFPADNSISEHTLPSVESEAMQCIAEGRAREICLWIAQLHSLSLYVIGNDSGSPSKRDFQAVYAADMAALGLGTIEASRRRLAETRSHFDEVMRECEAIASIREKKES